MLSNEEARERLAAQRDEDAAARRVSKLHRKPRRIAEALLGSGALMTGFEGHAQVDDLRDRHRQALFEALAPALAEHFERMWETGAQRPYQGAWDRRAFRAPSRPEASAERRFGELAWLARSLHGYEVPDAAWLARWAPHIGYYPGVFGLVLAAAIDGGDEEVLEILYASADGEEEIGGMGRHVTAGLLGCGRREAWEAVVRLLLAAQRQEGLRQVILEAADEAHPGAFALLLDTVLEHGLVRFSATARAAAVWLGMPQWAGDERGLNALLERTATLRDDPGERTAALGGSPQDAYLALAATAWTDAYEALPAAERLLEARDAERRFAATHLLAQVRLPEAAAPLARALGDEDLRVAARAYDGLSEFRGTSHEVFERLDAFLGRLGAKEVTIEPAVWPWTGGKLVREQVGVQLLLWGRNEPVERLADRLDVLDPDGRAMVLKRIEEAGPSDAGLRGHVVELLGDPSPSVREAAVACARKLTLRDDETEAVEALLSRKAGDLRRGVVALLLGRGDEAALASADRLLTERRAPLRLGGLELLRRLVEEDRSAGAARERARAYAAEHPDPSADEKVQLDALLEGGDEAEPPTLDDGLGLIDPAQLTPPATPRDRSPEYVNEAAMTVLRELDELVHEHRDVEVIGDQRLGEMRWWPAGQELPVPEVWAAWDDERAGERLDLVRALLAPPQQRATHEVRKVLCGKLRVPELRYESFVQRVLEELVGRRPIEDGPAYVLDVAESLLALIPRREFDEPEGEFPYWRPDAPWRVNGWTRGLELARTLRRLHPDDFTREQSKRLWGLERWAIRPTGGRAYRPPLSELAAAYRAGAATEADAIEHLLGETELRWGAPGDLAEVSGRRPRWGAAAHEILAPVVERVRARVLEVELARGEAPTAASRAASALRHAGGVDTLVALVQALGSGKLVRGWSYDNLGRDTVFSHLIRVTHPGSPGTPQEFPKLPERRLADLAAFAPQWARHVEAATGRKGLASGIWWMHAHTKDDNWHVEQEVREEWTAEVAERTRLGADELVDGAVDVGWFRDAHEQLGEEGWALLDRAARYCSSSGGHKRAQLFAAAMLGEVGEQELLDRMAAKRHQDTVRALGLLPLPDGEDRDAVLLRRYEAIQEFARESRQFGSQRQASEKRAAAIGLENLARTAGYEDPTRLGWAMEARGVADLAEGPAKVQDGDVEVTLAIDDDGLPDVAVTRAGRPLKSVPPAVRKNQDVKALRARAAELRKRRRRMRDSLEDAMIRGDEFPGAELAELAAHPLLWPMLRRLVMVGEGGLGRPAGDGRILERHDGEQLAVGPTERVRLAHPLDLLDAGDWPQWQRHLLHGKVAQPFKQVFRELYVPTRDERGSKDGSQRYAGHQLQSRQAVAVLGSRGWVAHPEEGVRRTFHAERLTASLWVTTGFLTPAEVEPPAVETVLFTRTSDGQPVAVDDVPPRMFSEVMRDVDLAVSVAHAGGVDPEASASTVEMRAALVAETCRMLDVGNVRVEEPRVLIEGELGEYSVHLGSATVHRRPGGALCIVPVSAQQRGRLFLPFADDDPRTAEVLAKVLMLARDREIKDPTILEQLRA